MKITHFKPSEKELSILQNPFQKNCIMRINATAFRSTLTHNKVYFRGSIEFENNNTKGRQNFDADSFGTLLEQMEKFMESL